MGAFPFQRPLMVPTLICTRTRGPERSSMSALMVLVLAWFLFLAVTRSEPPSATASEGTGEKYTRSGRFLLPGV